MLFYLNLQRFFLSIYVFKFSKLPRNCNTYGKNVIDTYLKCANKASLLCVTCVASIYHFHFIQEENFPSEFTCC